MKKFKFKSLTMRIWVTFTVIILIIVCSISFLYLFAYRQIAENAKIQDLKIAHDILKGGNYNQPNRFDELRNLGGSNHFIINIDDSKIVQIIDISKRQGPSPYHSSFDREVKMWMAGFGKDDNLHEKVYKEAYNKVEFLFIISSIRTGQSGKS